ncbi:MAG: hypothetical protein AAGU19_19740 [Prolixibacteraceae bacterium]
MKDLPEKIEWNIRIPIFRNPVILRQLALAVGIPFGLLLVFLAIVKAYEGLILVAGLLVLAYLFMLMTRGGKYDAGFSLDKTGIRNCTMKKQARKNRIINMLTVVAGFLSGKPAVAGAALLAQSRQDILVRWSSIKKVKMHTRTCTVMINAGFGKNIAVFCTPENYTAVASFIAFSLQGRDVIFKKD